MKTTIEVPDPLFRAAKVAAAQEGKSLREFFTEALRQRLRTRSGSAAAKPWEAAFGGLKHLHKENQRIARLIQTEFETVDEEEWR